MGAEKLAVGQEVRVFTDRRYPHSPVGGWRGSVTRVGRTLADIEWDGRRTETFVMATGQAQYGVGGYYYLTLEDVAARDRRLSAVAVLNRYGFVVSPNADVTVDQIEAMAAILRPAPPPEGTPDDI